MPEITVPPPPKSADTTLGDKFREAFSKISPTDETPPLAVATGPTGATGPASTGATGATGATGESSTGPTGATSTGATGATSPGVATSALEAALGKDASAAPPIDEVDEFEKIETPKPDDWKRAREAIKRRDEELKTLRAAPQSVNGDVAAITQERDELRGRVEKMNANLKAINAEYSEEFQGLVADREKVLTKIGNKMKYAGSDKKSDDLVGALNMPEGKARTAAVKEALGDLETDDRIAVRALIERLDESDEKISDFRKDLPAQWDKLKAQRDIEVRQRQESELKLLDVEFKKVTDDLPKDIVRLRLVPNDVPGAKEWNEPIQQAVESALSALKPNGADFKGSVTLAIKGGLYDHVWNAFVAQNKELAEARAKLKEFDESSPEFKGHKPPAPAKIGAEEDRGSRYRSALAAQQTSGIGP